MIDIITRGSLGELGSILLDFYINNAIWINTIVAIYAILIVWAHRSYDQVGERIKEVLIAAYGDSVKSKSETWFTKTLSKMDLDWNEISAQVKGPFIAPRKSFALKQKTGRSIQKLFTPTIIKSLFLDPNP